MATKVYEGMFLLDSNRYARDPGGVSGQVVQILEKCGGEILASRLWNEQKLAYPVDGHRKGTYWLTYFRMDSQRQGELTRACRLNENILRNLIIRIDDRLVDTLVRHATTPVLRRRPWPTTVATNAAEETRRAGDDVGVETERELEKT